MAVGIDVFFAGLMLICLDGYSDCSVAEGDFIDTAYAVKAVPGTNTCGWSSWEETTLEVTYSEKNFTRVGGERLCSRDKDVPYLWRCTLDEYPKICVWPEPKSAPSTANLSYLLQMNEIDWRILKSNQARLKSSGYVASRVHFPRGDLTAGSLWPPDVDPTLWYRSNDNEDRPFPSAISDELRVSYKDANKIEFTGCDRGTLLTLQATTPPYAVRILNRARKPPVWDREASESYDQLSYLLWYYRLAHWRAFLGACPLYSPWSRNAVVLRCKREGDTDCAYNRRYGSVIWPIMLGPKP